MSDFSETPESGQKGASEDLQRSSQTAGESMQQMMSSRARTQGSIQNPRMDSSQMQPSMKQDSSDFNQSSSSRGEVRYKEEEEGELKEPVGINQTIGLGVYTARDKYMGDRM